MNPTSPRGARAALVTGGAVRVGREIALSLSRQGYSIALTYRTSRNEAEQTARECRDAGVESLAVECDQRDPQQVRRAVERAREELGGIDLVVNNASYYGPTSLAGSSVEEWDCYQEVNVRGPWLFAQAAAACLAERRGAIVNLLDAAAEHPYPGYLPYCTSKAALAALTLGLARELAPDVRVNGIAIGVVLWPEDFPEAKKRAIKQRTPLGRTGSPADVARACLYLAEAEFVTGEIMTVDGGRRLT